MGVELWRTLSGQGGLRNHGIADDQRLTTNDRSYVFALAFSFTCPPASSTENSTSWQWYCLRISAVFFCTNVEKESRLPVTFSPAFFLAATSVLYKRSSCSRPASLSCMVKVFTAGVPSAPAAAPCAKPYTGCCGGLCSSSPRTPCTESSASCGRRYPSSRMRDFLRHRSL